MPAPLSVVVADPFDLAALERLRALGAGVVYVPNVSGDALARVLADNESRAVIVRSTRIDRSLLLQCPSVELIIRAGAGVDTIDVAAATDLSVWVANCPGQNAAAVAELTWGLILALDRRIPENVDLLRRGIWDKKAFSQARGLRGRTLGLLGFGAIGREVASRGLAFGMKVAVWSRRLAADPAQAGDAGYDVRDSAADVAAAADVLSLHLALTPDTRHLVNDAVLGRLQPGSLLINTARAELVDPAAMEAAIERGVRVGLDVFAEEPTASTGAFTDPVAGWTGVYGTHHIGASTAQAQEAVCADAVRILREFCESGKVLNAVNHP